MPADEQRLIRDTVRESIDEEIAPDLPEADRNPLSKDDAIDDMQPMAGIDVGPLTEADFVDPLASAITAAAGEACVTVTHSYLGSHGNNGYI